MNLSLEASLGLDTEKKASDHYQNVVNEINPKLLMISHQNVWRNWKLKYNLHSGKQPPLRQNLLVNVAIILLFLYTLTCFSDIVINYSFLTTF